MYSTARAQQVMGARAAYERHVQSVYAWFFNMLFQGTGSSLRMTPPGEAVLKPR